jgi:hypothetical protein
LSEKDEVAEDIDQREVGSFVHKVLRTYFDGLIGRVVTSADLDAGRLRSVVDRLFAEEYGTDLVGQAFLVKQQVSRQLDAFLKGYQIPIVEAKPITLVGLEQDISITFKGHRFAGRIDRIEQRGGRHVILDYKTGRDDKKLKIRLNKLIEGDHGSWHDAIGSFQLIMYMLLYSKSKRVPIDSITPAYLFLGRHEITPDIEIDIGGGKYEAAEVYRQIQPVMLGVIEQIANPEQNFEPTRHLDKACPDCPYMTICGTSWVGGQERS